MDRMTSSKWPTIWWCHQMETFSASLTICAGNSPVNGEFPSQRPVTRALMFYFICAWINGCINNREAGDLRRHRAHYDVIVMETSGKFAAQSVFESFVSDTRPLTNNTVSVGCRERSPCIWFVEGHQSAIDPLLRNMSFRGYLRTWLHTRMTFQVWSWSFIH